MVERIEGKLREMAGLIDDMVELVYRGLIENDHHFLNRALNKEVIMDSFEKEVTQIVSREAKTLDSVSRKKAILLSQTAQNIERMGDELRSLMERIEIKVAEKLLFSDQGVTQYKEVFEKMRHSVKFIRNYLDNGDKALLADVMKNGDGIKELIEKYRSEHLERLAQGACEARAANMYFDMLDFTGNIARHCTNIARTHSKG